MHGGSRPRIGLLASSTVEPWAVRQWAGVVEAAKDFDVELVSYIGGVLRSARYDEQANVMYDLAASARLDGIIVWSTALGWLLAKSEMAEFLARFGQVPMVSLEMSFPGMPSVLMDDRGGMRAAIDHLIEEHGRRRIAFLRGAPTHEGFEARYVAYLESLEAHGIAPDPRLVASVSSDMDGATPLRAMLGGAGPGIDALAGADDVIVLGALPVLAERGLRVPEDVSVAGFDNMPETQASDPPLTSADPPFRAMGRRAMETLVGMLSGRPAPECERIPVGLVLRRSCGCRGPARAPLGARPGGLDAHLSAECAEIGESAEPGDAWSAVEEALLESRPETDLSRFRELWDLFAAELRGGSGGTFLGTLERELSGASGSDPLDWAGALSTAQRAASAWMASLPYGSRLRAWELWGRAQELCADSVRGHIVRKQIVMARRNTALRQLSERLGSVYEIEAQMDIVARHLAALGIPACYLSLFEEPDGPAGQARLVLARDEAGCRELPPGGIAFPAAELVPSSIPAPRPGLSRLALALFFGPARIGFIVFDIGGWEDAPLCEMLRWFLSGIILSSSELRAQKAAAAEKMALLRELQHRVKNSIGIIASIAGIQSEGAAHPETREALASLEARIAAVGDLYEALFDSGGEDRVELADYLSRVVDTAAGSIGEGSGRIVLEKDLSSCGMDLKRAVSFGLIANELVTDSLKHAFPEGREGRIGISLAREGADIVLAIEDDGVGFPPGFRPEDSEGFGLQLVFLLSGQLGGELSFESGRGLRTTLRTRAPEAS